MSYQDWPTPDGMRSVEVNGQRFDYGVPALPGYDDPDSPESLALRDLVIRVGPEQLASIRDAQTIARFVGVGKSNKVPVDFSDTDRTYVALLTEPETVRQIVDAGPLSQGVLPGFEAESLSEPATVHEYQEQALLTRGEFGSREELVAFSAMGLAAEAGEAANVVCKWLYHGHPYSEETYNHIVEELGDVLWFATSLANAIGADLFEVMLANNKKLRRRYNGKFSTAKSIARVDVKANH